MSDDSRAVVLGGVSYAVTSVSSSALNKGQDALYLDHGFCGVADGATPLFGEPGSAVTDFAGAALRSLSQGRSLPVAESFRQAIVKLSLPQHTSTTCSIAILVEQPGRAPLEAAVLGDCAVVAATPDGSVTTTTDHRLAELDGGVIKLMSAQMDDGAAPEAAWASVREALRVNRLARNSPEGYWTFGDNPTAAEHLQRATFPQGVAAALICSDGFMRLLNPFRVAASEGDLLHMAEEYGLDHLVRELRSLEERDKSLREFPRLGISDDATAILLVRRQT